MIIKVKDPQDVLDYQVDYGSWLPTGDTITASTWTFPSGITKDSDTHDDTTTTVWVSGGTLDANYEVLNHIVTNAGRERDFTFGFHIAAR